MSRDALRFYRPSADAQLRAAVLRAFERGVAWSRIDEVLLDDREDVEAASAPELIDELEPERREDTSDDSPTSPSLEEKRAAWLRLNRVFK